MSDSKVLPHFDLYIQCRVIVDNLPLDSWDELPDTSKRAAGLSARWAIENAFRAAILERGKDIPKSLCLLDFWRESEISLVPEQETYLKIVNAEVTSQQPEAREGYGRYYDCCRLAIGVLGAVGQTLTMHSVFQRKRDRK